MSILSNGATQDLPKLLLERLSLVAKCKQRNRVWSIWGEQLLRVTLLDHLVLIPWREMEGHTCSHARLWLLDRGSNTAAQSSEASE